MQTVSRSAARRRPWAACGGAALCLLLCRAAGAELTIHVGSHPLEPNTPNQTIQLLVTGGDPVEALNFNAQIADGGPELEGLIDAPVITAADIVNGTIFDGRSTGQQDPGSFPQLAIRTTTTASGTVNASGLLATLTIDTTGFTSGTYSLRLLDTLNGPTDFATVPVTITDGSITVVPEPGMLAVTGAAAIATCTRRRRRRRPRS